MADVVMPRLSDSMEEGVVLRWLKQEGDMVALGEELVEIETDKANMVYEADSSGPLTSLLVAEGESALIGVPIAVIGEAGDQRPGEISPGDLQATGAERIAITEDRSEAPPSNGRAKASPLARRVAAELSLDLARVEGSGPGGRIVRADIERAAEQQSIAAPVIAPESEPKQTAKGTVRFEEPSRLQEVVARRMAESKATAPHFYLTAEIDMGMAVEARRSFKNLTKEGSAAPSFNDLIVKACAIALRDFPHANGAFRDGHFELYSRVNVGIAVAARDALVVPTVFDADHKGLAEIAAETGSLAGKVRAGTITPPELAGGTFTVSNLGMYGIRNFDPVISPPQAAILAVGEIAERPTVRDGKSVAGTLMEVTLACDHRILYGADAAEFLARIRGLLQEPLSLVM